MQYKIKDHILKYEKEFDINHTSYANYTSFQDYIDSIKNYNDIGIQGNVKNADNPDYVEFIPLEVPKMIDLESTYEVYFKPYEEINKHNIRLILGRMEKDKSIDIIVDQMKIDFRTYQTILDTSANTSFQAPTVETLLNYVDSIKLEDDLKDLKSECIKLLEAKRSDPFVDAITGLELDVENSDRIKLESLLTGCLAKLSLDPNDAIKVPLWDLKGVKKFITKQEAVRIIGDYFDFFILGYESYKDTKSAIESADNVGFLETLKLSLQS